MGELQLVCAGRQELPLIREQISQFIKQSVPDDYILLEIAVNEAINNAMRYGSEEMTCSVHIRLYSTGKRLVIRVKDGGEGFSGNEQLLKLSRTHQPTYEELYKESGRGLYIMKAVTDYIKYNQKGNEVLLVKYIGTGRKPNFTSCRALVASGDNG